MKNHYEKGGQTGTNTTIVYIRQLVVLECSRVISSFWNLEKKAYITNMLMY